MTYVDLTICVGHFSLFINRFCHKCDFYVTSN